MAVAALSAAAGLWSEARAQQLAFPEAQGFGRFATGARTSLSSASVYHVTNLNDSGAGSFRDAVSGSNRFVVFDVGGIINISSVVPVSSNITIAAQTAPGGIAIYGDRVSFTSANNLISRYLAVRKGSASGRADSASLARGTNMMFDHMSVTWGVDETFSMNPDSGFVIDNVTIQNTIIGQGLDVVGHSAGGLMTLAEGARFSVIKSLFADNVTRNPKVRGENEYINNVVYGWENAAYIMGDTVNEESHANAIGNFFIEGPVDGSGPFTSGTANFHIYGSDNWVDANRNGVLDASAVSSYPGADVVAAPFAFPTSASMTAQQALTHVLDHVGLSIARNPVDQRIVDEVKSYGTTGGVIVRESDLFPNFGTDPKYVNSRARLADADNDGIADDWETAHGLSPSNATDWKNLNGGYTRLEEYVNELGATGTTLNTAGGTWTNAAIWGGTLPTLADTAIVTGGVTHASGNAFARRATLDGSSTISGGTFDVFDTMLIGAAGAGTVTISSGTVTAGQIVLGATGQSGSLALNGGTLIAGPIVSGGGTAALTINGGATIKSTGALNIAVPTTVTGSGGTINTNGISAALSGSLFGSATLTKAGAGTLTLAGSNNGYSGGINLSAGTLVLATSGANSSTGAITAATGTTINVTTSGASTPLALASGATVTITAGGLTYNGAVTGAANTTLLVSNSSTGTSNFSIGGNLASFAGTLDLGTSTGNIRIGGGGSSLANFDAGDSTGTFRTTFDGTTNFGSLTGASGTRLQGSTNGTVATTYVIGANGKSTTFAGTITDGTNSPTFGIVDITKTGSGTLTLRGANTYSGATTVDGGKLVVGAAQTKSASYTANAGATLELAQGGGVVVKTTAVATSGTGRIDLKDNKLIVAAGDVGSWTGSNYTGISALIRAGRNGGNWSGGGIVTSLTVATSSTLTSIGIATAQQAGRAGSTFGGVSVGGSDVLVMYTYGGDANLDGKIDVLDYGRVDSNVPLGTSGWFNGDFNYDGKIDVLDYGIIDFNISIQGAPFSTASDAIAATPRVAGPTEVPEPLGIAIIAVCAPIVHLRRRNRRQPSA